MCLFDMTCSCHTAQLDTEPVGSSPPSFTPPIVRPSPVSSTLYLQPPAGTQLTLIIQPPVYPGPLLAPPAVSSLSQIQPPWGPTPGRFPVSEVRVNRDPQMATESPVALPVRLDISSSEFTLHWPYASLPTSAPAAEAGGVGLQHTEGLQSSPAERARGEMESHVSVQNTQTSREAESGSMHADDEEPEEIHYWPDYLDARNEGCSFDINCPICSKGLKVYGTSRAAGPSTELEDAYILHCGHFVGVDCMDHWMQGTADNQAHCPMCRASLIHERCGHLAASKIKHPERAHFDVADVLGMVTSLDRFEQGEPVPRYCLDCARL